ncbi:GLUG motif-containing protein [uncultured Subdoligranulum sp.]|uniref:GLUG motif-containing protein n=1 Tax=uncultured Subdoligranulum sp. TaxID=512298 RepID=UPI0025F5370B|nr:GLUG motif-containing protein [uncultured Subdoligranulum sp.]
MKKQRKRLLAAVLSLCMLASLLAPAACAEGEEPATLEISTADQLLALARDCRLDSWSRGRTVVLTADIDLTGCDFTGIPTFGGTLEGEGYTVSGLTLSEEGSVQGLFRYIQQDAVVQNLHVTGTVQPGGTRAEVGGLAGENAGTIHNCSFSGTVSGTSQIGGIAGSNTVTGLISGCIVDGSVYGTHFVGGLAGQNDGVISGCTNNAAVNTTVSQNEVKLEDLTLTDLLTTENGADITDIGGIAGSSAGVVRACTNRGAVGYDHIGYNVGGIVGSQTGYVEGCVNYGTVHARKEGGGIVGQMEPSSVLQYSQDTLQQLQGELNTLQGLMNQATRDASASASEMTAQFEDLKNRVDSARSAVDTLIKKVADGIDIGTRNLTVTALGNLAGQAGAGAGVQGGASSSTDVTVNPTPTPTEEPEATPSPETTPEPTPEPTPEITPVPEPVVTPQPTVEPTAEPTLPPESGTEAAPETERAETAHNRPPHREPGISIDHSVEGEASAGVGVGGDATLDGQATLTVPSIEVNNQDAITAARNSLGGSLTAVADGVDAISANTGNHTQALIRDIEAITNQMNTIANTLLGAAENAGKGTIFEDVSDEDTDGDTEGKVFNCLNAGEVYADLNAGGITGAMARENDLDPEDDTKISGSSSLNMTYKTRIVVRGCTNQGAVQAKKQGAGGIVGSMELGSVLQSCNTADLLQQEVDYVGGIAGQSKSIIRQCAAKGRLSGDTYVGGIAGSGYTITDCRAMVEATGTEKVGAVAGGLLAEDSLANALNQLQDATGTLQGNCFVSETLGGVDGVSYAGQAEPVSFTDFAALAGQENLPETFTQITLTFVADGQTVAAIPVEYGASFAAADAPAIPEKAGCTAVWSDFPWEHITFDQTITAVYTPYSAVIASAEQREDGRAILLAEGSFGDGTLTLTACEDTPAPDTAESWQFTLPDGASGNVQLHYLPTDPDTDLYLRGADGTWRKAETTTDGSYLVCTLQSGDDALAAVPQHKIPLPLLAGACAALVILLAAGLIARKRRHKAKTTS